MALRRSPAAPRRHLGAPAVATAAFFAVNFFRLLGHAMWRDELQAWLLARDSATPAALLHNLRYEGHPPLWQLLLWPLAHLCADPRAMALLHLAIGTGTAACLLFSSPFRRHEKILLVLGYFFCFEYLVLSRAYALGVLLVFLFCRRYVRHGLDSAAAVWPLALAALTSIYGLFVALGLFVVVAAEALPDRRAWRRLAGAALLLGGAAALAVIAMRPPADSGYAVGWTLRWDARRALAALSIVQSALTLCPPAGADGPGQLLLAGVPGELRALVAIAMGAACLATLRRHPACALGFGAGALAMVGFAYVKLVGDLHHHGHVLVLFLACLWIAIARRGSLGGRRRVFVAGLLVFQAAAGIAASVYLARHPLSAGRAAAAYLRQRGLLGHLLVGDRDSAASAVAGYVPAPFYYPGRSEMGSFVIWDQRRERLDPAEVLRRAARRAAAEGRDLVLVLNYPLPSLPPGLEPLARFERSLLVYERFYLYRWPAPAAAAHARGALRPSRSRAGFDPRS